MSEIKKKLPITRMFADETRNIEDDVISEFELSLNLNGTKISTLLCTPYFLEELIIGHLYSAGMINNHEDLKTIQYEIVEDVANVSIPEIEITQDNFIKGGDPEAVLRNVNKIKTDQKFALNRESIFNLMEQFKDVSELFNATGAAHSNCLCTESQFLVFSEDVARHNAVDKTIGKALRLDIPFEDKILIASCRVSKALSLKIAKAGIPVIASVSAVTDAAIDICEQAGITLIGFARGKRMNVYTHPERIK